MTCHTAISVTNLSKRYLLGHQGKRERYTAFRDVLARGVSSLARSARDMLAGRQIINADEVEEFWALNNISFKVEQGEAVGIIGRNGAGKSTLLKVLSRITEPTRGRIEITGRVASLLEVGTGFHPELTGRENIYLNGAILGMMQAEIRRKFDEIVDFADVEKFLDTPVKRYSSGMYVRLAFAVAAHLEPEILVVDEVLAVGDSAFQKKCLGKMRDVSQGGRTVLFVSHNMEAIARLCSRCIFIVKGELAMQGETREVIKAYSENSMHGGQNIDLSSMPRRFEGTGSAKLLCLRRIQNSATSPWCFEYGTPFAFVIEFSVSDTLIDPEIGFALFSLGGSELVSGTTQQESPLKRLDPGHYTLHVSIPDLHLNPGNYNMGLGIACSGRSVDHVNDATQLEILPSEESIRRELQKIWAPITPRIKYQLDQTTSKISSRF